MQAARLPEILKAALAAAMAVVAAFLLVACSSTSPSASTTQGTSTEGQAMGQVATVDYPASIEKDDYEAKQKVEEENPVEGSFILGVLDFSYASASQVLSGKTGNANYSPASLYYALALCGVGASGETQQQILGILHADDAETLAQQGGNLFRQLYADDGVSTLKLANSLWLGDNASFQQNYLDTCTKQLYATPYQAVFGQQETDDAMSKWVAEQTGGTLAPKFQTSADEVLSIINTVYFKDAWSTPFDADDDEDAAFHASTGDVDATYLTLVQDHGSYHRGENYTRAGLWFASNAHMVFVLPDKGVTCQELIDTPEKVKAMFSSCDDTSAEVTYHVPKFSYDTEGSLVDDLKALGMTEAFEDSADFSNMTSTGVKVSEVRQGTHIALDENGVIASAYTEMGMSMTSIPVEEPEKLDFRLDRPFIYVITSSQGIPLFMGICANPAA